MTIPIRLPFDIPSRYFFPWIGALMASSYWSDWAATIVLLAGVAAVAVAVLVVWERKPESRAHRIADAVHGGAIAAALVLLFGFDLSSTWEIVVLVLAFGCSTAVASLIVHLWDSTHHDQLSANEQTTFAREPGRAQ